MFIKDNSEIKRYKKISNNSGCVSEEYNIMNDFTELSLLEDRKTEFSGEFNIDKGRK